MPAPELQFNVVNLERRADRRAEFLYWNRLTPGIKFAFSNAIDARTLDTEQVRRAGLLSQHARISPGHLACALSHREVLLVARERDRPTFICEDDAVLRLDFVAQWQVIHSQLPVDWDIVLFGYNFDSAISMELIPGVQTFLSTFDNRTVDGQSLGRFRECLQGVLPRKLLNAFGTLAYAVSPAGAGKLLQDCFPLRNDDIPIPCLGRVVRSFSIDCLMNKYFQSWNAFAAFPPIAITSNDKSQSDTAPPSASTMP